MGKKITIAVLSDKDKKIILQNTDICTETHGKGCNDLINSSHNKKLN